MERIDLTIDVTEAARLGEEATIALTVHLPTPQALGFRPTVCFAKPGGGFTREYFTADLPGPGNGSQAEWHAERGWVFVSVDHLGVGGSSRRHDPSRLGFRTVTAASHAAEQFVLDRLAQGALHASFPPIPEPMVLGIGQSMGGCLTVAQQGRYHRYDGIGVLGYGAVRTHVPVRPGEPPVVRPWILRDTVPGEPPIIVNATEVAAAQHTLTSAEDAASVNDWLFHYDDVDVASVRQGPWVATTYPTGVATSALGGGRGRGRSRPGTRAGGDGRARRRRGPARRTPRLSVGDVGRPVHLPADGTHAQLRWDTRTVLAAHRNLGIVGQCRHLREAIPHCSIHQQLRVATRQP